MALRNVNMVPESVLQGRYLLRHGVCWALAYGLLAAALLTGYFSYTQDVAVRRRSPMKEGQVRKYLAEAVAEMEAKKEEIEKLAFVRHVSNPFGAAEILGRLAEIMHPETWLRDVSLDTDGEAYDLVMHGRAFSNARLGMTLQALSEDARFEDVVLKSSSEVRGARKASGMPAETVKFSIETKVLTR